jgi:hypothetical protein
MKISFSTLKPLSVLLASLMLIACGGGGGSDPDPGPTVPEIVEITGRITYDRVPFSSTPNAGLDYDNIQSLPVRGISVELVDAGDVVQFVTKTDEDGNYAFRFVDSNQNVRVRVIAELNKNTLPAWDIQIRDNTNIDTGGLGALYALDGSLASSGITNSVRDLHASSGWDNSSSTYTAARAAAPFAILDTLYDAVQLLGGVDARLRLADLDINWSTSNRPISGDFTAGEVGSSFFRINMDNGNNEIFLLGQADVDTDEFDADLILHEWAHFIEQTLSRADTLGGPHNIIESLDMRLALSEGFANAFSGIVSQDPIYKDSFGTAQATTAPFDVEANPDPGAGDEAGWYVESSIHSLIYDFYDDTNEGVDNISLGLGPLYNLLINTDYIEQTSFTSIFSFAEYLKTQTGVNSADVDALLAAQNISGSDGFGTGETNNDGFAGILPVYQALTVDGPAINVCSTNSLNSDTFEFNKLGNRNFIRFSTDAAEHTITVSTDVANSSFSPGNPAFVLHRRGQTEVRVPEPDTPEYDVVGDSVTETRALGFDDEYILEVFSRDNIDNRFAPSITGGDVCFNVTITH